MSEMTQMGVVLLSLDMSFRTSSKGCLRFLVAVTKGTNRSIEGRLATFSHPSGIFWTFGNGIIDREIDE